MLLHVSRRGDGRRRLSQIALLRRDDTGRVAVLPAWHVDRGEGDGYHPLMQAIRERGGT